MHVLAMANYLPRLTRFCVTNKLNHKVTKHIALSKRYSSALFVSGRKASEVYSFLTPYLDIEEKLENSEKFQRDLTSRGLNVNVNEIKELWEFYKSANKDKTEIQSKMVETVSKLKVLSKQDETQEESEILKLQLNTLKEELKGVREIIWDLSENFIEKLLKLPNEVDERTPLQSATVIKSIGTLGTNEVAGDTKNHVEIGRNLGLLEYKNPMQYYLCNDAALFEIGVLNYAGKVLAGNDMIRIAGADFSRSLVVEGSGLNHEDPMDAFVIDNHADSDKANFNHMHLVGGASLVSFLAMHAKQLINPTHFPVKYFSTGRQYTPFRSTASPIGLFTVCQASVSHAFVLVKDANHSLYRTEFDKLLQTVSKIYENICDHYRIVTRPVPELRPWETMRVSFELWSPHSKQYIEVGHISMCGSYFSKRLLIAYQTSTGRDYPAVISGTVLSVPRLLGCLLEQNEQKFVIPEKILEHMPIGHS